MLSSAKDQSKRRRFGVNLFGVVVVVALVVAAVTFHKRQEKVDSKDLIARSELDMVRRQQIEEEVLKSTGLRVRVVEPADFASVRKWKKVGSDANNFGPYGIKFNLADRILSGHDGQGNKLTTENGILGDDDRWELTYSNSHYKFKNKQDTSNCLIIQGDGDVRLNDCSGDNAKMALLRVDTNSDPNQNYDSQTFLLYGYETARKFVKCSSGGTVSSGGDPGDEGYFAFVDPQTGNVDQMKSSVFSQSDVEKEISALTGVRMQVVQREDLLKLGVKRLGREVGSDGWSDVGKYSIRSIMSNRYLSSVNGKDKKLETENVISGNTEKWDIEVDANVPMFRFFKAGSTSRCIKMNTGGDVKLNNDCNVANAKFILARVDPDSDPDSSYDKNWFVMYAYAGAKKFIVASSNGDVSSSRDPVSTGYFMFDAQ